MKVENGIIPKVEITISEIVQVDFKETEND
jgi:hypothetical protein